jgi:transcriptional regulator with XRE-family HTH domain
MQYRENPDFALVLKNWLCRQGPSYKRSDLAKAIGISPRHLNNVIQGKRNLSPEAQARASAAMGSMDRGPCNLKEWLKREGVTARQLSVRLGKPLATVKGWAYRGRMPSAGDCRLVYSVTGLPQYDPDHTLRAAASIVERASTQPTATDEALASQRAKVAVLGLHRLTRNLQGLADGDKAGRDVFRQWVSGPDIGYLRSLLAALLDEQQLEDWRRMSSYKPRLGGKS